MFFSITQGLLFAFLFATIMCIIRAHSCCSLFWMVKWMLHSPSVVTFSHQQHQLKVPGLNVWVRICRSVYQVGSCHRRCFIELGTLRLHKAQQCFLASQNRHHWLCLATFMKIDLQRLALERSVTFPSFSFCYFTGERIRWLKTRLSPRPAKSTLWSVHNIPPALATKCSAQDSRHSSTPSVWVWCSDMSLSTAFGWLHALALFCDLKLKLCNIANAALLSFGCCPPLVSVNRFSILQ